MTSEASVHQSQQRKSINLSNHNKQKQHKRGQQKRSAKSDSATVFCLAVSGVPVGEDSAAVLLPVHVHAAVLLLLQCHVVHRFRHVGVSEAALEAEVVELDVEAVEAVAAVLAVMEVVDHQLIAVAVVEITDALMAQWAADVMVPAGGRSFGSGCGCAWRRCRRRIQSDGMERSP
uniref:Uncharacterized protein n=1 Tax=Globodera rostochiensis TaxID=31243 RepID=A0A914H134_GLORO